MKFLITGGAGFIGSAVVRHLISNTEHSVVNLDKLTYAGNLESLSSIDQNERYVFVKGDICEHTLVSEVFEQYQPDIIMHLAAESHVDRSIDGPLEFLKTNVLGTYTLLDVAKNYYKNLGKDKKQNFMFHHISTDEVYGDLPHPNDNKSEYETMTMPLFTEESSYQPSSPYSASKASSDHLVRAWSRTYGLPTLVTNCSNNYGPYHFPEKLIPLTILNALDCKKLPIYGDGSQIRDWLYVDDHARALVTVALSGKTGDTYNIGGNNEKTNLEVVQTVCAILDELVPMNANSKNQSQHTRYSDLISFVQDRPGHDRRYAIDARKIQRDFGWMPLESFDSGIRKTVEWYLQNDSWWKHVLSGEYSRKRLGMTS